MGGNLMDGRLQAGVLGVKWSIHHTGYLLWNILIS